MEWVSDNRVDLRVDKWAKGGKVEELLNARVEMLTGLHNS